MLRYLLPVLCAVLLAGNVSAGEQPRRKTPTPKDIRDSLKLAVQSDRFVKPNTLTEQEIGDGWILLFDGETTYGWEIDGAAKVADGALVLGGDKATTARFHTAFPHYQLQFDHKYIHRSDAGKFAHLALQGKTRKWTKVLPPATDWQLSHFDSRKNEFNLALHGSTSLAFHVPAGVTLAVRNLKLKPKDTKSLFNGKNLDGWKVLPGYKSKYTVTKEGWLNVKDGRGDIQTTDTFKDFVLQLECISNGKHLNSGIFFRCIPNQYQQGYEAQIRNEFTPGKKRPYTLDKYDPETHKKIGTYKVESTAVDYGTGAIYRRMPARKQMSKDGEWFTMTVVANGRHFATWVNGVLVAEWTDNRPVNDNARQGCCLNAGVISIQGHDPTTDLSFRNIRIAEVPSGKK